jgi:hypothetical protein
MMMSPPYSSGDGLPATRRGGKRMQGRVGLEQGLVHLCMLVYTCNICMYVWLTCDPCNSVCVFAHLYMAGKASS